MQINNQNMTDINLKKYDAIVQMVLFFSMYMK